MKKKFYEAKDMTLQKLREKLGRAIEARFGRHSWAEEVTPDEKNILKGIVVASVNSGDSFNNIKFLKVEYEIDKDGNANLSVDTTPVERGGFVSVTEAWARFFESLSWEEIENKLSVALDKHLGLNHLGEMRTFVVRKRTFADKVVFKRVSDGDLKFFQMNYELDNDNNVVFTSEPEHITFTEEPVKSEQLTESCQIISEADKSEKGSVWRVALIKAGTSLNRNHYPREALKAAVPLFEGVRALARSDQEHVSDSRTHVKDIVGWFESVKFENSMVTADFHISAAAEWLREAVFDAWQQGKKDLIGFSIVAEGTGKFVKKNGQTVRMVESISKVSSVDVVVDPAAGGKFLKLVAADQGTDNSMEKEKETMDKLLKLLEANAPDLYKTIDPANVTEEKLTELLTEAMNKEKDVDKVADLEIKLAEAKADLKTEKENKNKEAAKLVEAEAKAKKDKKEADAKLSKMELAEARVTEATERMEVRACQIELKESLAGSELWKTFKDGIMADFMGKKFEKSELEAAITRAKSMQGDLTESGQVRGLGATKGEVGKGEVEKTIKALDGFFDKADLDNVPRFRSFREAYLTITGDTHFSGKLKEAKNFHKFTEALTTSSWPELLGDSITRRMLAEYRGRKFDEWKLIVSEISTNLDFRSNRRMRMGGYGTLPAVAQAGSYDPLTSPGDEEATYAISKRGGTETITMEMIADDDVGAIRRIPKKLARLAKITLYRFVFDMIRTNITMTYDSVALFNAAHSNTATGALNAANLLAAKILMADQAAFGSAIDILGAVPKYLLIPSELQDTAFRLTTGKDLIGATNNAGTEPNIHSTYGLTPIVIPYWTDGTDWVLVADIDDIPTIEIGFFQGQEEPELFVADQATVGSMFTNDQIVYKLRHIYGGTVLDHRAFFKGIVAGT